MAKHYTLSIIDTSGVQEYIFGSNRLRENVGASQLVEMATNTFLDDSLKEAKLKHNRHDTTLKQTLDDGLDIEVIYQGGGNALLLARSEVAAKQAVAKLSRLLLARAPGLEIAATHLTFNWDADAIGGKGGVYNQLLDKLGIIKQQHRTSAPLLGQGVTLECRSTGLPAIEFFSYATGDMQAVSADVRAKVDEKTREEAKTRLRSLFDGIADDYDFSDDFDNLGGTEDQRRYIAVVHADGNNMGRRFQTLLNQYTSAGAANRACLRALQELSAAVAAAGRTALRQTVSTLVEVMEAQDMTARFGQEGSADWRMFIAGLPENRSGEPILPFRPIVFGGDDVTFVCDGRLGLPLAAVYLAAWEQAAEKLPYGGPAYACAGVAVVKTHYPFVRAYTLAADLCKQAKSTVKKELKDDASALDWHFALSGVFGPIRAIRDREYTRPNADLLHMRPVLLGTDSRRLALRWRTWPDLRRLIGIFRSDVLLNGGERYTNRNKVKGLREALRGGGAAVEAFRLAYQLGDLPALDVSTSKLQQTGWADGRCGYFDAIEAMDFFLPLEPWEDQA